jgi:large-conductance mechanosensitive channel
MKSRNINNNEKNIYIRIVYYRKFITVMINFLYLCFIVKALHINIW